MQAGHSPLNYRADIDGLRGVAVLAVVLFHAGWGVPGGYVGVDVFFVISGFLMTSQLTRDLDVGCFSLLHFWERRIRRIWPAALLMTTAVLLAGGFLMLPADYATLAVDAGASTAMLANVRYWLRGVDRYFEAASDLRPLLHMWSLGIEEQFYVLWPLLLSLTGSLDRQHRAAAVAATAVVSYVASQWLIASRPEAVFYLLPFRAWELLLGALGALTPIPLPQHRGRLNAVVIVAFLSIIVPCGLYDRATTFPAAAALLPCLGTALLLAAGHSRGVDEPPVTRLLAVAPLVGVGRISYSLYLWHWPVLACLRYVIGPNPSLAQTAAAVFVSLVLAVISWKWVEQSFRPSRVSDRGPTALSVVAVGAAACGVVTCAAAAIWSSGGWPGRFSPDLLAFARTSAWSPQIHPPNRPVAEGAWQFPTVGHRGPSVTPCFLLWGDSHGIAIGGLVDTTARHLGITGAAALRPGTLPLPGAWDTRYRGAAGASGPREMANWNQAVLTWMRAHHPRHVMLAASWHKPGLALAPIDAPSSTVLSNATLLRAGLDAVRENAVRSGATLWILRQIPTQPVPWRRRVMEAHLFRRPINLRGVSRTSHDGRHAQIDSVFAHLAGDHVRVVDLAEPFFGPDGFSIVGRPDESWYHDGSHISQAGATRVLGDVIRGVFTDARRDCDPGR